MLKWFSSPKLTVGLLAVLGMVAIAFYGTTWLSAQTEVADVETAAADFNIAYLTAEDTSLVEPELQLANLQEASNQLQLEGVFPEMSFNLQITHSWEDTLKSQEQLHAVIVHHSAAELVDWTQAAELFQTQELVVAGFGIPGRDLAHNLGIPSLYIWDEWNSTDNTNAYATSYYYYIYSLSITGNPTEVAKYRQALQTGQTQLTDETGHPTVTLTYGSGTDSLHPEYWPEGPKTFMNVVVNHVMNMNPEKQLEDGN